MFCQIIAVLVVLLTIVQYASGTDFSSLATLEPGRVRAENALWIENPVAQRFNTLRQVEVANLTGPGVITMIHFAMPQLSVDPAQEYTLGRDLLLRIYWDGETSPSVDCPMVDFFCDPAGLREQVNTALVNKRRGFNAYFPMPFRKSARIVLDYEGPEEPGDRLWSMMPCYSYVVYRQTDGIGQDQGYFHAQWRQASVRIGKEDYPALEADGRGKFVGWSVTVRRPGSPSYPVDMNEKFYIDGEQEASVEFQGIEDSFGFSWGYPETENVFPLTGYWPFMKGAMAYRFFINDAISFSKSLRVQIGFGVNEHPMFREEFSKPGTNLQFSTVCYWYQTEPHRPFPPMLKVDERAPAPEQLFWPDKLSDPDVDALRKRGVRLYMQCGVTDREIPLAVQGFAATMKQGFDWSGWSPPVYHCRADEKELQIELHTPPSAAGKIRLYIIDPDRFHGGRRQHMYVGSADLGVQEQFHEGRWVESTINPGMTDSGKLLIRAVNLTEKSNAAISIIEWVADEE